MILGHLRQPSHAGLPAVLVRAIALAQAHDLHTIAPGRYELQGDNVLMNVMQFHSGVPEEKKAELHSQFIDIQILLAEGYMTRVFERDSFLASLTEPEREMRLGRG